MNHTSSPWNLEPDGTRLTNSNNHFICHLEGMDLKHKPECRANAQLIVAAPDLLKALTQIHAHPNDPYSHRLAIDAINKATSTSP